MTFPNGKVKEGMFEDNIFKGDRSTITSVDDGFSELNDDESQRTNARINK